MLQLHAKFAFGWDADPAILRIATDAGRSTPSRGNEAFLVARSADSIPSGFHTYLAIGAEPAIPVGAVLSEQVHVLPESFAYLADGDIVLLQPRRGELWVIYRRSSPSNSMLVTERCNSRCLMCSQPPKDADDLHLVDTYLRAIPLMDPATPELGITGGEPTLLGRRLLDLVRACKAHLPQTALHMLSNGRLFYYLSLCQDLAEIEHPDLMIGIPLYSDIASQHDFVVQARGAFDQTIRGMMNLERCGLRVELRVVLHRQTASRLPSLARFIVRNLPFVEHVALMGLEVMGYVRMNLEALWIDPVDYGPQLVESVRVLTQQRMTVSIYNHQLCTIDEKLWPYARKSISDWKNEYLDVCGSCSALDECGGFFSSATIRRSSHIRPIADCR
jgi:His-Xaa-Ser system radical SAM maturase HxsC